MNRFLILIFLLNCSFFRERLALHQCRFSLESVHTYDFSFTDLKLDFEIKVENPNRIDAVLDRLTYTLYVNNTSVFSGTTGKGLRIKAKKSARFTTTITLVYKKIGEAIVEAIKLKTADYRLEGKAHISTIIGDLSYPVKIQL
ncbi:hypothetical protein DRP53_00650 [candidate division WOR-3 bacterium]|uniref:Water stress and hypersensitive response domain-containing protein n=1 Tax=candidate division WOR-3 bacterium TaxID=2052148 RepID=A0A660SLP7_UNCW3|nr:MAG: hypothetical protein DRP53_00650 [candidate division WOR-3 bacterium]